MRDANSRGNRPPRNPGVRELVAAKRRWSSPLDPNWAAFGFRGWHERGYLPHRDEPGLVQFVTFRLADSFPQALRSQWQGLLSIEDDRERRRQLEGYLDAGRGACHLRRHDVASTVEGAIRFFHPQRYRLRAWVIMPNHVHVLFETANTPMSNVVECWKSWTAREVNKLLGRKAQFWAEDYWDTYMRSTQQELTCRRYIENNPVRARLVRVAEDWPWSSASFHNPQGVLHL